LIILIAGGVIVVSLLITSFILPLCVEKNVKIDKHSENQAYLEILQTVIAELKRQITPENKAATAILIANYHGRSVELQRKQSNQSVNRIEEQKWRKTVYEWEKENIATILQRAETDEFTAQHYLNILNTLIDKSLRKRFAFRKNALRFLFHHRHNAERNKNRAEIRTKLSALVETNTHFIIEKLKAMPLAEDSPVIRKIIADYELKLSMFQRGVRFGTPDKEILACVVSAAFQTERDSIQSMLELGRISRESAREMRHNISLLEVQLKKEYF